MALVELDGRSIASPVFCGHKRGKNWCAIIEGTNAANAQRNFVRMVGPVIDLTKVNAGDVIEIGGDYISGGGVRRPDRRFWLITRIDDAEMSFEDFETLAKAIRAAREQRAIILAAN